MNFNCTDVHVGFLRYWCSFSQNPLYWSRVATGLLTVGSFRIAVFMQFS